MAKGDDVEARKRNKATRKKLRSKDKDSSSAVTSRIAAIIAAKKRRQSGKRKKCQGMCFSLPTPEDPFNDRDGNKDYNKKETKTTSSKERTFSKEKRMTAPNETVRESDLKVGREKVRHLKEVSGGSFPNGNMAKRRKTGSERTEVLENEKGGVQGYDGEGSENSTSPSKFLVLCLNAIENTPYHDLTNRNEKPLFIDTWGIEFWKYYSSGHDILDTSGFPSTDEQIAWVVSSAADSIARKEKEGLSFSSPFLLFLVPTQEKAIKVRSLCKPLKALGVHTVSIHPGASLDHQIQGLKSCEPEFLVSTPERLLELVSVKAIDISAVSLLVVDGLESLSRGGYLNMLKSIRHSISGDLHTIVFSDSFNCTYVPAVQDLLRGSIRRMSLNVSVACQSACIIQSINFCTFGEEKRPKIIQALDQATGSLLHPRQLKVLIIIGKECKVLELAGSISEFKNKPEFDRRLEPQVVMVDIEQINTIDLGIHEIVFILDVFPSIDKYVQILTGMARHSVNGVLHSFITKEEASVAASLIEILEQCGQAVPETVRSLCLTQATSES